MKNPAQFSAEINMQLMGRASNKHQPSFDEYVNSQEIDGTGLREDWFTSMKANVFLSHSHEDVGLAWAMAAFLHESFGLTTFIDSAAWGYSDNLLKQIDKKYCWDKEKEWYDYNTRNRSTSHVHMMLATALSEMIDRCECVFFLNTPASIAVESSITSGDDHTASPWIFHELITTRIVKRKLERPIRRIRKVQEEVIAMDSALPDILYRAPLDHLTNLNDRDLSRWATSGEQGTHALDHLYVNHG